MAEKASLDIHALVKRTGFDARTIRRYAERGLIPRPDPAGRKTTYGHEHVVLLLAIRKLYEDHTRISAIGAALRKHSFAELEAMVGLTPRAPKIDPPPPTPKPAQPAVTKPSETSPKGERWWKVSLLPGLDLMMREGSTEFVRRVAREIEERYSTRK